SGPSITTIISATGWVWRRTLFKARINRCDRCSVGITTETTGRVMILSSVEAYETILHPWRALQVRHESSKPLTEVHDVDKKKARHEDYSTHGDIQKQHEPVGGWRQKPRHQQHGQCTDKNPASIDHRNG